MLVANDSHFPIVFVTVGKTVGEEDGKAYAENTTKWAKRAAAENGRYYLLADTRSVNTVTPIARKVIADFEAGLPEADYQRMGARIVISNSKIVRGAITAMSWFTPRMKNVTTVSSVDLALEQLRQSLAVDELTMSAEFEALVRDHESHAVG